MKINKILISIMMVLSTAGIIFAIDFFIASQNNSKSLYSETIQKTVEIRCCNNEGVIGYATGTVISNDGLILTNKHVVMNNGAGNSIEVRFYNEANFISANIVKVAESQDIALIKINRETPNYFKFAKNISGGESVYTFGNPNGFGLSFSEGVVSSPLREIEYSGQKFLVVQTSLVINEGNSGGPLINNKGEIIGLVSFRLRDKQGDIIQGVSFGLHNLIIQEFLLNYNAFSND